ncbi:MAG TPA: SelB C-terminal domain-containing protein [Acidimicrobiia bacterium]
MRVIATAGHVDHGKSSLVQALTGTDPDRFPEEKSRGLTIDLGFAFTTLDAPRGASSTVAVPVRSTGSSQETSGGVVGFVDVPGHVRFAKNMLAGVGSVDIAMLVVDAREGWMPQTAEHVQILELLGIEHGCIALTKADLVDDALLELARIELDEHLAPTRLATWPVVVCDSVSGRGIDDVREVLALLCSDAPPARDIHAPRLWVDRSFSVRGVGTVVTGTLTLGTLAVGDHVSIEPSGRSARVRGIESHHDRLDAAAPGTRVALNLVGVDHHDIARGDAIVHPGDFVATTAVDVELLAVEGAELADRAALHAHLGSGEWAVRWRRFGMVAGADERRIGRVRFPVALPLQPGDRMVLRSTARRAIVGGAVVLDVAPPRRAVDALGREAAGTSSVTRALAGNQFATASTIARLAGLDRVDPLPAIAAAEAAGEVERLDDRYAAPAAIAALVTAAAHAVGARPDGVELAALAARLECEPATLRAAIAARPASGLEVNAGNVRTKAAAEPSVASTPDGARLLAALRAEPFAPPSAEALEIAPRVGKLLVREGVAVELDGVLFAADAVEAAKRLVGSAVVERGTLTVADIRDLLGSTRKFVLPIAKRLDADGVTRRRGDDRIPGPRAPKA